MLLAVAFVSLALSGEAQAKDGHHEHHSHHAGAEMAANAVAEPASDHAAHSQDTQHLHDGECNCLSASCAAVLMPAPPAQLGARVIVASHNLPPVISADAQAVSGPPARPPRA